MKYEAYAEQVDKIFIDLWNGRTVASELMELYRDDYQFLIELVEHELDEEFNIFHTYQDESKVASFDSALKLEELISMIRSKVNCCEIRATTVILSAVEIFLINGKRMMR